MDHYTRDRAERISQRISQSKTDRHAEVRGSITIEMAYILPVILMIFLLVIYTVFYYHDKNILNGAAAETAVVGAQNARQKGKEDVDLQNFFRERVTGKLVLLRVTSVEVHRDKKSIEVSVQAGKGRMRVSVFQKAVIPKPEDKIRKKRQLESIGGAEGGKE